MNRKLKELFTICTLIAVFLTTTAFGSHPSLQPPTVSIPISVDDDLPVKTETAFGLQTTTFDTLEGTVTVNLPDDLAAGDTISGTVIAEAKKQTAPGDVNKTADQPVAMDELSGYVVEVAKQPTPTQTHDSNLTDPCNSPEQKQNNHSSRVCSKWSIPDGVSRIPLVLKNRVGKIVSRTEVPVAPKGNVARAANDFSTPPVGQAGKPLSVRGPFDGDFANTRVRLANHAANFLASSPRKVVVESPRDLNGPAEIEIEYKGNTVAKCTYRNISVRLAADKLNLIKGEQTTLTVNLSGLIGLRSPVSVQLTNKSPQTVSMGGGETQTLNVDPGDVNGNTFTAKRTLTGVKAGGFSINAVVDPTNSSANGGIWRTCNAGPGGGPHTERLDNTPANLRQPIAVGIADIQALDRKLNEFSRQLSNDEQAAMALLLRRAARAPMDEPLGTAVKVSFFADGGRTTQQSPYGTPGGRPPNPVDPLSATLGGDTDPLAIGPKHEDPATPRPDDTLSIGPKHEDPARPHPEDTLSIGPKHEDPARPRPDDTLSIGPKHEDPARPRPDTLAAIGPKHEDPMPAPDTINALAGHLKDFSQQLSTPERGMMDWLLQRASLGAPGSESSYGTPGGRPPSPDQLQRADTNESKGAASETGRPIGSPGGLPPLVQALGVTRRGDVNGSKRWLLRF